MTQSTCISLTVARFDRSLSAGEDTSWFPKGALAANAGTEVAWMQNGLPKRDRTVRLWFSVWSSPQEAHVHFEHQSTTISLLSDATETWSVLAAPFASHGPVNWSSDGEMASLYPSLTANPGPDAPTLVITTLGLNPNGSGFDVFGRHTNKVRQAFSRNPDVIAEMQMLPDLPALDGPTFSIWRAQRAMMQNAYQAEPHKTAMNVKVDALARGSFTRAKLLAAAGTWNGVRLDKLVN